MPLEKPDKTGAEIKMLPKHAEIECATDVLSCRETGTSVIVVGLGNPLLCDDTVGLFVLEEVKKRCAALTSIHCTAMFSGGIDLICELAGFTKAIVVDCIQDDAVRPGEIISFKLVSDGPRDHRLTAESHGIDLTAALSTGRACGYAMPEEVLVYGIGGGDCVTFSEKPTTGISASISKVADLICENIASWLPEKGTVS